MTEKTGELELQKAISLFEETTVRLRASYDRLQEEVAELRRSLAAKDRELGHSLAERDRLADYLAHLLESVPSGVIAVDPEGRVTTLNRAAQEIVGFGEEAAGESFADVFPWVGKEGKTGSILELLEKSARPEVAVRKPGGEIALLGIRASPFRGEGGEVLGRVVVFQDVTRLKRLEEQQERNRRLVAMGEMAAGIAHEIRNPLGSLELFASHLRDELRATPHEELAGHVLKGIQNLSRITGNLLLFARKIEPKLHAVELSEVLSEALLYVRSALSAKDAVVEERVVPCRVMADADLLRQALLNLLLNAVQAVKEGGRVQVEIRQDPSEATPTAVVQVADDGPGVAPEAAERIFDPFFTTRPGGIGLGLAIVQRIVSAHGGWVSVAPGDGGGARFTIGLPTDPGGHGGE